MMQHLEAWFAHDNTPFDCHGNRVWWVLLCSLPFWHPYLILRSCFPHVINLAVQAIYAALKDGKGLEEQYLL